MLRDKLLARLAEMGDAPDHQRLAADVLGIRGAPPELARRLVAQALVLEDRRDVWRRAGTRICRAAPATPGVYVLKDADGRALYVGKAANLRRRLHTHFADRRWRAIKPGMSRASDAEWQEVGSELEALLREAALIETLQPPLNVQTGAPALDTRDIPRALIRDLVVLVPSIEADSVELVAAAVDGRWMIQRTRRSGADLAVHSTRVMRFFRTAGRTTAPRTTAPRTAAPRTAAPRTAAPSHLAPIVFSWLAHHGDDATRLDPHDARSARELARRLGALFRDNRLFHERLQQC